MKKVLLIRHLTLAFSLFFITLKVYAIEADIQTKIFYVDQQPYVEINYIINSRSKLQHAEILNQLNFTAILKTENTIIKAEKLVLNREANANTSIMLHVFRWSLPAGKYQLSSTFENPKDSSEELTLLNNFEVNPFSNTVFISNIEMFSLLMPSKDTKNPFYKNGYYYEPLPYQQILKNDYYLMTYAEVYNTATSELKDYILHYKITPRDSSKQVSVEWFKRKKQSSIEPIFVKQDISDLPSGDYVFTITVKDLNNRIISSSHISFTRINPFWDKLLVYQKLENAEKDYFLQLNTDTVDMVLKSLSPVISTEYKDLIGFLHKSGKVTERKLLNYQYWKEYNATSPTNAYHLYVNELIDINQRFFSGMGQGFETDRGIIQIKYGKPNEIITEEHDNGAYPYEIWKYNKIEATKQVNVKFLFYDPGLTGSAYILLHSTARGEKVNKQWEVELYKNVKGQSKGRTGPDAVTLEDNFLRRARTYFEE